MRPKVATTEATPRMTPTTWRMLRERCELMSTMPSTKDSQTDARYFTGGYALGVWGQSPEGAESPQCGAPNSLRRSWQTIQAVVFDLAVHDLHHALALGGDARVVGDDDDGLAAPVE